MTTDTAFDVLASEQAFEGEEVLGEILESHFPLRGSVTGDQLTAAWAAVQEGSWHELGASEDSGGFALPLQDLAQFSLAVGRTLAPVPLAQSWALTQHAGSAAPVTLAIPRADMPGRVRIPDAPFPGMTVLNGAWELTALEGRSDDPYARVAEFSGEAGAIDRALRDRLCVLWAAEAAGTLEALVGDAVEHARSRAQFGQPIGKFQAVKHLAAEAEWARQEALTALIWVAVGDVDPAGLELIFTRCLRVSELVGQVHGGIGMTWELGHHYATRRIITLRSLVRDLVAWKD